MRALRHVPFQRPGEGGLSFSSSLVEYSFFRLDWNAISNHGLWMAGGVDTGEPGQGKGEKDLSRVVL